MVLEVRGFRVSEQGEVIDAPLDTSKVRVKLSAMSFRIPARGTYTVFYEATADSTPAWFNILSAMTGARTESGLNVRILLPHVVYLNQKQALAREDVAVRAVEYDSAGRKVRVQLENLSPRLGRVLQVSAGRTTARVSRAPDSPSSRTACAGPRYPGPTVFRLSDWPCGSRSSRSTASCTDANARTDCRRCPNPASLALAMALLALSVAALRAQTVVEVEAGGSSLLGGYGATANFWRNGVEGWIGLGYLDGIRAGAFFRTRVGKDTLRVGNDVLLVRYPTDMFSPGNNLLVQGVSYAGGTANTAFQVFGGASSDGLGAPSFQPTSLEAPLGALFVRRRLSPTVTVTGSALVADHQIGRARGRVAADAGHRRRLRRGDRGRAAVRRLQRRGPAGRVRLQGRLRLEPDADSAAPRYRHPTRPKSIARTFRSPTIWTRSSRSASRVRTSCRTRPTGRRRCAPPGIRSSAAESGTISDSPPGSTTPGPRESAT